MGFVDKLPRPLRTAFILIRDTLSEFGQDKAARIAAALAYYAAFAIAPMLLVVIGVVGLFWGASESDMQARILAEISGMIGEDGASVIGTMLENTSDTGTGIVATIAGIGGLIWGATRLFAQLQGALNDIWNVAPKPGRGIMKLVTTRVLSFGMVLVVGLLMLVAMVIGTVVTALRDTLTQYVPGSAIVIDIANILIPLLLMTVLFAAIYRYLPDAEVRWRDVWMGAFITAILFSLGRYGIGFYLANSSTASTYGAAGSFGLLMLVAMVIGTVVTALRDTLTQYVPGSAIVIDIANILIPLLLMTVLFAAIYRYLPDAEVRWRDVWMGAFITAILFSLGRYGIGFYLANSSTASAYGAAGSFVLLLLWIYFTSMIFLFGAEFTQVWARHHGHRIQPTEHAVRVPTIADIESGELVAIADPEDIPATVAPDSPSSSTSAVPHHIPDPPSRKSPVWKRAVPIVAAFLLGRMLTRKD